MELESLQELRTLNLHNNQLKILPPQLLSLRSLEQLSLRGNPLISTFVHELPSEPLSLVEIAARAIKTHGIPLVPGSYRGSSDRKGVVSHRVSGCWLPVVIITTHLHCRRTSSSIWTVHNSVPTQPVQVSISRHGTVVLTLLTFVASSGCPC
jgi:hypothetical protein